MIEALFAAFLLGQEPTLPADPDALVKADLEEVLRDVESARIRRVREPRWATVREDVWTSATGWAVCYSINAQNAYGGYTGAKDWLFVIAGDKVVMRVQGGRSMWFDSVIERECSQIVTPDAAPPPEA